MARILILALVSVALGIRSGPQLQVGVDSITAVFHGKEVPNIAEHHPVKPRREQPLSLIESNLSDEVSTPCRNGQTLWKETGKVLGKGANGIVSEVSSDGTSVYALKQPLDQYAAADNKKEMQIMTDASSCSNVLHLTDERPCVDKGWTNERLMSAYVAPEMKGDLLSWVRSVNNTQRAHCAQAVFKQLWDGLSCLHASGWIHGDFKEDNVFYQGEDREGCPAGVVLADFGLSEKIGSITGKFLAEDYQGSSHLPSSMFKGKRDYLNIAEGYDAVKVTPSIDLCSLAEMMWFTYGLEVGGPASMVGGEGECGPMGPGRKERLP
mmetsp:Transcript_57772/g.104034  ORF Transcript_57772/g.104034 Transcript_57772/m.104034 type:complete len:323 (-) Transcript_57772:25-993(-)